MGILDIPGISRTQADARYAAISAAANAPAVSPHAPSQVRALAGNASAVVSWVGPSLYVPDSYEITSSPGGIVQTVAASGPRGSVTMTGLTNGVAYTFTVKSINGAGKSVASAASNSVTPTAAPSSILPVVRGLMAWYSASNLSSPPANGAELATWPDLSGNGFDATRPGGAGTGGTWVSSWSNSKPAVAFNGSSQQYTVAGLVIGDYGPAMTAYCVYDATVNAGTAHLFSNTNQTISNASAAWNLSLTGTPSPVPTMRSGRVTIAAPAHALSAPQVIAATMPGSLAANGTPVASKYLDAVTRYDAANLCIGAAQAGFSSSYLTGRIAELILFNVVHTPSEIAAMTTYLNSLK